MLKFCSRTEPFFASQDHDWKPVVFIPLDEQTAYRQLDAYYEREVDKRSLREVSGIDDDGILDRLVDAGFTTKTLPALHLAPIVFVAWASDSVTNEECQAAVWSIHESRLFEHPAAAARVQSWLDVRPSQEIWDLWMDYTECWLPNASTGLRREMGTQLLEQATAIALASGGIFGIGRVCAAEQVVLQAIRNVYRIG